MHKGAIAVLDVLGFKGIWQRKDPQQVISRLKSLAGNGETFAREFQKTKQPSTAPDAPVRDLVPWHLSVRSFSDTLVIACTQESWPTELPPGLQEFDQFAAGVLVTIVCEKSAYVAGAAAAGQPPFAYRGSIAYGELLIDDQFLIGPAVDEAAAAESLAEGAFIWLCPSAHRVVQDGLGSAAFPLLPIVPHYPVPMKNKKVATTHVINPFGRLGNLHPGTVMTNILGSFEVARPDARVTTKRRNTEAFLRTAEKLRPS